MKKKKQKKLQFTTIDSFYNCHNCDHTFYKGNMEDDRVICPCCRSDHVEKRKKQINHN